MAIFSASGLSASGLTALYSAQNDRASSAVRRPAENLSREVESTRVRLSAFGQIQSAASKVQVAAQNLQDEKQLSSATDAKNAAETFVKTYNNDRAVLAKVTESGGNGRSAGSLAEDGRARVAAIQLERTAAENSSAFREVGIRVQQDGSLSIDAKALEAAFNTNPSAVTEALGNVGRAAETTTTRQLSNAGGIVTSVSNLTTRVQQLETRQLDVQVRADQSQRAVESASRRYGFGASGAGVYLGIFGL